MQNELHWVEIATRVPQPDWAYLQKQKARCIASQPAPLWNTHRTGSVTLPSLCVLQKDNDSWKNVKFFTTTICYFPAFISTQADRVKKLSFSEPAFLCSGTDFAMLMKRQRFSLSSPCSQNKRSNLRGIQKRLRNYGVTSCDLISRGEADLHPLCYSITADQYIRQSICINTSMKVWQLQSGFPW